MLWSWHSAKLGNGLLLFSALPSAVTIALDKLTKTSFFNSFFTFHHDKHKLSHISHIHPNIHHIFITFIAYITAIAYITNINPNIYRKYHSYPNIPLVHDKYIRNPSRSEQQMQIQLMLLIRKVETECLVKEKLDQTDAHELDYLNPPTEAAQRRRHCMC